MAKAKKLPSGNWRVYWDDAYCVSWPLIPHVIWNNKVDLSSGGCYFDSIPLNGSTVNI